jgi:nucleoside-diphosphate-sugar epimerase
VSEIDIFCFGFGQVAKNFIKKLSTETYKLNLSVTSRSESSKKASNGVKYNNYLFDDKKFDKDLLIKLNQATHILISIPPINKEDIVLKNFSEFIKSSKAKWITYLSSTSVYGDHKGEWVNESSKTNPFSDKGLARLESENSWISFAKNNKLPIQIFRLSGIYSNEKNTLSRLKSGEVNIINKTDHYFSRIHVEDIANFLFASIFKLKSGEIYNLADDKPSSSEEIILYAAKLLGIKNVKKIEVDEIKSEMLKNFYKESKKVSNEKIKNYFNYKLKFPSYIEGLSYIRDNFIKF